MYSSVNVSTREHARAALDEADQIGQTAKKSGRQLLPEENARVRDLLAAVQDFSDQDEFKSRIEGMRRPGSKAVYGGQSTGDSVGDAFIASQQYQGLAAAFKSGALTGNYTSGPVEVPNYFAKTTLTTVDYPISEAAADVRPGIQSILQRPITITDLLGQGTTTSGLVRYVQETMFTNGAAPVAEGDLKPESAFAFDNVDEPVRKIATFLPLSEEMVEDASQMRSYLDGRLRLGVQLAEETQLLAGDGAAPNLRGLLNRTGLQSLAVPAPGATANPSIAEYLYQAITNVRVNAFVEPDGIVLHPTDYAALRLAKDSADTFNAGGPFGALAGNSVWGLPVALSQAIPVNTALVGAFRTQAQIFRRSGLVVEVSNSHADFFRRNMLAIRAELRAALCVFRPSAFHVVTDLQNAGQTA